MTYKEKVDELQEQEEKIEELEKNEDEEKSMISFKSDNINKTEYTFGQRMVRTLFPGTNASNVRNSFPKIIFSCCFDAPRNEEEIISNKDTYEIPYSENEIVNGVKSLFPSYYIRKDEINSIKFGEKELKEYMEKLSKDEGFVRKFEKFDKFKLEEKLGNFDEFGIRMDMKDQNEFSSSIPVTRCLIEIPFSNFTKGIPSVEQVGLSIINPEIRTLWDNNFIEYKIRKQLIPQKTETLTIVTKKMMQMLRPREFFEKRTHFVLDGIFYSYSSSAPDNIRPPKKEPMRCMNYFGIFKVENDGKNIIIDGFHQIDIKIGQPGPLIFMSLPLKIKEFTIKLIEYLNK